jgi:hypothetical protein
MNILDSFIGKNVEIEVFGHTIQGRLLNYQDPGTINNDHMPFALIIELNNGSIAVLRCWEIIKKISL